MIYTDYLRKMDARTDFVFSNDEINDYIYSLKEGWHEINYCKSLTPEEFIKYIDEEMEDIGLNITQLRVEINQNMENGRRLQNKRFKHNFIWKYQMKRLDTECANMTLCVREYEHKYHAYKFIKNKLEQCDHFFDYILKI